MTVRALDSIFRRWGIYSNSSNISGWPCRGIAADTDTSDFVAFSGRNVPNPSIKCVCTYNNNTLCHITHLLNLKHQLFWEAFVSSKTFYALNIDGMIPDELWTLTFLTNLNLDHNYLTGPLSPSIGNLTRMQYFTIGTNALSGELPKELGKMTDMRLFAIGSNNFSGPLPSELGNWTKLEQLYIDSSGVSGEIPSTLAKLQNMAIVWASDTELTGRIPDFIGNWSKLTTLRFQGNSFDGPIPSSFSNLNLTDLRISGLSNGSSTLAFMKNMKSLSFLELRNNNISDSIPSNIGEFQSLQHLDLSFNNLGGDIPDSLFSLSSLANLFLGDNKLNGTLPAQKSTSLLNMNVVANNLTIDNSNSSLSSALPFGMNCLQRNFPCNRGAGIYYNFSIKAGGPQIMSSNGIVFERDNETLGPASYFVSDTRRWGVSNVGSFAGNNNPHYTSSSSSQFTNTLDPELFQTARISASSLRYYGLGLENGDYNVILQFAEMAISDTSLRRSVGRRVFDIYIQGNRVLKDFDIKKEAGGISERAVQKQFKAQVSENYLEIHLFWAGKGTCCIPALGTYGPSISAISATPSINPPANSKKNRTGLIVGNVVGVGLVSFLSVIAILWIVRRRKRPSDDDEVLLGIDAKPYTFSYSGKLGDGRAIAVKQLSVASHQGKSQFVAEIVAISAVQHRNLVKLYGCCTEGSERLLVYEYLENSSLDQALFDSSLDEEQVYLLEWAWHLHENDREAELVDSRLPEFNEEEVKRIIGVALLCTQTLPSLRPPMSRVVAMLYGDMEVSTVTTKPGYLTDWKYYDTTTTSSFIGRDKATIGAENQHSAETDTEPIRYNNL
ncbi:hypothetical protein EZV62_006167 [Acer yangbiense]|uniref:non-specific serine/threonine protein kinase n=1 Tax=Acer yangbiense TaxID=1000413 RepID=A0A5C7IS98_9ROSI|nr:hypothetical protein EZV62_006167 [Acer yangbiense]